MTDPTQNPPAENTPEQPLGRNEPCPCGSGKKYKRCHGVSAAPLLSQPKNQQAPLEMGPNGMPTTMPPGMEHMTPEMMTQVASMLQRLPKGQLQKLQSIMQRAMAGKDVTREAEEFQRILPPEFQQMLMGMGGAMPTAPSGVLPQTMSEEEARRIVADAASAGKISSTEAETLLKPEEPKGISKLWKNLGKKS
jgi:hypothetical protein